MATTIAQIGGFELWDILQLAQTSRMSIKLSVESSHGTGSMFFQGGSLLHAVAGGTEGDDAVNIILDWREGSVSSSQLPENCPTTVRHSSIVALLMDRARQRDRACSCGACGRGGCRRCGGAGCPAAGCGSRSKRRRK